MTGRSTTRRDFLTYSAAAAGVCLAPRALLAAGTTAPAHPVRMGGPVPKQGDPEEAALAHRNLGYRAAYCPAVKLDDAPRIREISAAFAKHDVILAEVGRWVNLLDADPEKRAKNLQTVTDGLALAEAVGARCCVDIAGSCHPTSWFGPHPDNDAPATFDAVVDNARKIIDAVKPKRAKFTYEVMGWALPDGPDSYLRLIKAIDRPAFGVHLDPCNAVNSPHRFYHTTELLNEFFDKLGPWIASCHAKDVAWSNPVEMQVHILEVLPGKGVLDYATYLKRLAALPSDVPLMMEHLKTQEEYAQSFQYITSTGRKAGVEFL